MPRTYTANPGDSFTFGGDTFTADKKGVLKVADDAPHDELLSHGFTPAGKQGAADDAPQA